jgi:hypothetical protein
MWNKPREILGWDAIGYEISYRRAKGTTPAQAVAAWRKSPAHIRVVLNQHEWQGLTFRAMGVAIAGDFAVVWFSETEDESRDWTHCQ